MYPVSGGYPRHLKGEGGLRGYWPASSVSTRMPFFSEVFRGSSFCQAVMPSAEHILRERLNCGVQKPFHTATSPVNPDECDTFCAPLGISATGLAVLRAS